LFKQKENTDVEQMVDGPGCCIASVKLVTSREFQR